MTLATLDRIARRAARRRDEREAEIMLSMGMVRSAPWWRCARVRLGVLLVRIGRRLAS